MVLSFHGGPEGQERPGFNSTYQALLASGIAVFAPNVRGSSGFGKKFVNLDNGALRFERRRDIEACVEAVVKTGIADPRAHRHHGRLLRRLHGDGRPDRVPGPSPPAPTSSASSTSRPSSSTPSRGWRPSRRSSTATRTRRPTCSGELSPIHKVDRVTAPTIVLHGANDTNVPVVEAEQVVESLKKRGVPVEYVLFPDEGHGWRKTPNRIRSTVAIVQWFEKYLKAEPGRNAAK